MPEVLSLDEIIAKALMAAANTATAQGLVCSYEDAAVAVRDALLAEGLIGHEGRDRLVRNYPARDWQRVLVIPLDAEPVVSPRPNQHQETP